MPDLTTEVYYHCQTAEEFCEKVDGSKGKKYLVQYGRTPRGPYQFDWSCNCDAYKFHPGPCKHIKAVKESGVYCGWSQFTEVYFIWSSCFSIRFFCETDHT